LLDHLQELRVIELWRGRDSMYFEEALDPLPAIRGFRVHLLSELLSHEHVLPEVVNGVDIRTKLLPELRELGID
jgi:hypothetical protein